MAVFNHALDLTEASRTTLDGVGVGLYGHFKHYDDELVRGSGKGAYFVYHKL